MGQFSVGNMRTFDALEAVEQARDDLAKSRASHSAARRLEIALRSLENAAEVDRLMLREAIGEGVFRD